MFQKEASTISWLQRTGVTRVPPQCVLNKSNIFPNNLRNLRHLFPQYRKCTSKSKHLEEASIQDFKKAYTSDRRRSSILRSRKVFTTQARPYSQSEERSLQWLQLCYKSMLIIKCGSQANRSGTLGGRQEDS